MGGNCQMQTLAELIHKKKKFNQKEKHLTKSQLDQLEIDNLLETLVAEGLISPDYRRWFGRQVQLIGAGRLAELAAVARQEGRQKSRYLTYLVRADIQALSHLPQKDHSRLQTRDLLPGPLASLNSTS